MAVTNQTFPRIEVHLRGLEYGPDARTSYLIPSKDAEVMVSHSNVADLEDVIEMLRACPEAGSCCPVYDFTTTKETSHEAG